MLPRLRTGIRVGLLMALIAPAIAGCASTKLISIAPTTPKMSGTLKVLTDIAPPPKPIVVAVYSYADQTGQFKPSDTIQTLSRAVSQGGAAVLISALRDAGHGRWFTVLERTHLNDVLKERQVITEMRARYLGETKVNADVLPPMLYAPIILEGGVIGYDSNTLTGGIGANFLGIGADAKYRQDTVSVYLRAISTKTGEVLANAVARKTIASVGIDGNAFRFVSFKKLLQAETGVTTNEPGLIALEMAIDKAVQNLILQGAAQGIWSFSDKTEGQALIDQYLAEQGIEKGSQTKLAGLSLGATQRVSERGKAAVGTASTPSKRPLLEPQVLFEQEPLAAASDNNGLSVAGRPGEEGRALTSQHLAEQGTKNEGRNKLAALSKGATQRVKESGQTTAPRVMAMASMPAKRPLLEPRVLFEQEPLPASNHNELGDAGRSGKEGPALVGQYLAKQEIENEGQSRRAGLSQSVTHGVSEGGKAASPRLAMASTPSKRVLLEPRVLFEQEPLAADNNRLSTAGGANAALIAFSELLDPSTEFPRTTGAVRQRHRTGVHERLAEIVPDTTASDPFIRTEAGGVRA